MSRRCAADIPLSSRSSKVSVATVASEIAAAIAVAIAVTSASSTVRRCDNEYWDVAAWDGDVAAFGYASLEDVGAYRTVVILAGARRGAVAAVVAVVVAAGVAVAATTSRVWSCCKYARLEICFLMMNMRVVFKPPIQLLRRASQQVVL